jgi:hypothetical protein
MSVCCRVSESEVKGTIEAITVQLKAQQDVCTHQLEEIEQRLQKQELTTKAASTVSSRDHAELLKRLQDAIDEAKTQASSVKESLQKELRVRPSSVKLLRHSVKFWYDVTRDNLCILEDGGLPAVYLLERGYNTNRIISRNQVKVGKIVVEFRRLQLLPQQHWMD